MPLNNDIWQSVCRASAFYGSIIFTQARTFISKKANIDKVSLCKAVLRPVDNGNTGLL